MYKTTQGDTWDIIAKKVYDDEYYMNDLIKANPDLSETVIFPANVEIRTPEITKEVRTLENLPPWKRGTEE